jgi:hypothetical protein
VCVCLCRIVMTDYVPYMLYMYHNSNVYVFLTGACMFLRHSYANGAQKPRSGSAIVIGTRI